MVTVPGAMANRYDNEVSKRALVRACDVSSVDEFRLPHDHPEGSLRRMRRSAPAAADGGSPEPAPDPSYPWWARGRVDPLAPPLVARWHLLFGSAALATDAIDAAAAEGVWLGMPVRDDSASMTLTKTIFEEELAQSREAAAAWADDRCGLVVSEQLIDLRDDPLSR